MLVAMRTRGFTLVELLIGIVILAVLMLLALPTFSEMMVNSRIRNTANSVANGMRLAQVEAIRRNRPVEFIIDPATGWRVFDPDPDPGVGGLVQSEVFSDMGSKVSIDVEPVGATRMVFSGIGRYMTIADPPVPPIVFPDPVLAIEVKSTVAGARELHVVADPAKNVGIRVCDPAFTNLADPKTGSIACPP